MDHRNKRELRAQRVFRCGDRQRGLDLPGSNQHPQRCVRPGLLELFTTQRLACCAAAAARLCTTQLSLFNRKHLRWVTAKLYCRENVFIKLCLKHPGTFEGASPQLPPRLSCRRTCQVDRRQLLGQHRSHVVATVSALYCLSQTTVGP